MVVGVATTRARHRLPSGSIPVLSQRLLISQGLVIDVAYRPRVRSRNRGDGIKTLSHTRHTRAGHDFPRPGRRAAIRAGAGRAKTDKKNDESTKNEGAGKRYAKISFHISTVNRRRCGTRAADPGFSEWSVPASDRFEARVSRRLGSTVFRPATVRLELPLARQFEE